MTLDDLKRETEVLLTFMAIFGCDTHFKSELYRNHYRVGPRPKQPAYKIFDFELSFH